MVLDVKRGIWSNVNKHRSPVCTESMAPVNCCEMVGTMTTPSAGEEDIARVTNRRDAASDGA